MRIIGLHPKDLKHPAVSLVNEESQPMTGYLVSLKDFPPEEFSSLRKLRIARAVQAPCPVYGLVILIESDAMLLYDWDCNIITY